MTSTTVRATPCLIPSASSSLSKHRDSFRVIGREKTRFFSKPLRCNQRFAVSCSMKMEAPVGAAGERVSEKVRRLVLEFESLTEPIDRVKRLLHYAAVLPPFDESARVPENKVTGCTTQVWLDAWMDENGKMRFRADSDSEITKGFCTCLIWILDGADPEEVSRVRGDDLAGMNVGVHGKAQSRVNTWHNVLMSMQKRTRDLVVETGSCRFRRWSRVAPGILCVYNWCCLQKSKR